MQADIFFELMPKKSIFELRFNKITKNIEIMSIPGHDTVTFHEPIANGILSHVTECNVEFLCWKKQRLSKAASVDGKSKINVEVRDHFRSDLEQYWIIHFFYLFI